MPLITRQHQQRAHARTAALAAAASTAASEQAEVPQSTDRTVIETALKADLQLLSERVDVKEKIALKRRMLPRYLSHAQATAKAARTIRTRCWCTA